MRLTRIAHPRASGLYRSLMSAAVVIGACLGLMTPVMAAGDPAVQFMERVAKDMMAAQRSRSVQAMQVAVARHGDMQAVGLYALGDYRTRLDPADRELYIAGMTRFIGRQAATESPKYPVARVAFAPESRKARYGITVDSTITLQDGSTYEISWLLMKYGSSYRVRDAQVQMFSTWMSPLLKKLFEDYIGQNNGNVKALISILQRH